MTIQRLYSLPNCTLVLEGLSDAMTGTSLQEMRPLLSTLVNVDCYLAANVEPLSGGRDFFESLVTAVSGYAQEFLSRVQRPSAQLSLGLVQLQQVDEHRHRLIVHSSELRSDVGKNPNKMPIQIDLTTVELFDLVEAVDQFLADSQTLPDLAAPPLLPVAQREAGSSQILVRQAVPASVGVYSLALSAIALFFVPLPSQRLPQPSLRVTASSTNRSSQSYATPEPTTRTYTTPEPTTRTYATPEPTTAIPNLAEAHPSAADITDVHQLRTLNRKLHEQLNQAWTARPRMAQDLVYRVGVDANGTPVGYASVNAAARTYIDKTPLLNWHHSSDSPTTPKHLAQFRVVFTKNGVLQVSPWWGYRGR